MHHHISSYDSDVSIAVARDAVIINYELNVDPSFIERKFTEEEKRLLRPVAEVLCMLDGNAFFAAELSDGREWYEQYLPEAAALYFQNGYGDGFKAVSWLKEQEHENDSVRAAYESWRMMKTLSKTNDN